MDVALFTAWTSWFVIFNGFFASGVTEGVILAGIAISGFPFMDVALFTAWTSWFVIFNGFFASGVTEAVILARDVASSFAFGDTAIVKFEGRASCFSTINGDVVGGLINAPSALETTVLSSINPGFFTTTPGCVLSFSGGFIVGRGPLKKKKAVKFLFFVHPDDETQPTFDVFLVS